jgi:hypothetical protein
MAKSNSKLFRRLVAVGAVGSILAIAMPAFGWNARGHMVVAAAAWKRMTPAAQAKAIALLKLNPDMAKLVETVPAADREVGAFLKAATWPDAIKSTYTKDGNRPPHHATDAQNIGYADCLQHRYWHFKDIPFSTDGTALEQPEEPHAASQIRALAAALADPQISDDVKSYDLSWLLHLVGDIHQPLHATSRFTNDDRDGDGGGNGVQLCVRGKACSDRFNTLHGFWDGALGNSDSVHSALSFACVEPTSPSQHCLPEPDATAAQNGDPEQWAQESFELARTVAYRSPIRGGKGPYYVTSSYRVRVGSTAEQQVALAGARLANLLEAALATGVTQPVSAPPLASAATCPRVQ